MGRAQRQLGQKRLCSACLTRAQAGTMNCQDPYPILSLEHLKVRNRILAAPWSRPGAQRPALRTEALHEGPFSPRSGAGCGAAVVSRSCSNLQCTISSTSGVFGSAHCAASCFPYSDARGIYGSFSGHRRGETERTANASNAPAAAALIARARVVPSCSESVMVASATATRFNAASRAVCVCQPFAYGGTMRNWHDVAKTPCPMGTSFHTKSRARERRAPSLQRARLQHSTGHLATKWPCKRTNLADEGQLLPPARCSMCNRNWLFRQARTLPHRCIYVLSSCC